MGRILRLCLILGLSLHAGETLAGSPTDLGADIAKGVNPILMDLNRSGTFDGVGAGDANFELAGFDGDSALYVLGDWNADGVEDALRYTTNTAVYQDRNGNRAWDGNAGGDRASFFAPGIGQQVPLVGDWDMDSGDEFGVYYSASDQFRLDANDNGTYDGNAGGDRNVVLLASAGAGTPLVGDWGNTGVDSPAKVVGSNNFIIDANANFAWDGNAGGDNNTFFASGQAGATPLVGDWDGDGDDDIGIYTASGLFFLDLNDNLQWDGNAGGDANVSFAAFAGVGLPLVCDWNGDGTDDVGKVIGSNYIIDLNGNRTWDGNVGGDRSSFFGQGFGAGQPLCGAIVSP